VGNTESLSVFSARGGEYGTPFRIHHQGQAITAHCSHSPPPRRRPDAPGADAKKEGSAKPTTTEKVAFAAEKKAEKLVSSAEKNVLSSEKKVFSTEKTAFSSEKDVASTEKAVFSAVKLKGTKGKANTYMHVDYPRRKAFQKSIILFDLGAICVISFAREHVAVPAPLVGTYFLYDDIVLWNRRDWREVSQQDFVEDGPRS